MQTAIEPESKRHTSSQITSWGLRKWLAAQRKSPLVILLLIACPAYFYHAVIHSYPVGYAGLYTQMAELLVKNHFLPTDLVPYYAIQGLPFAYPPLGIYLLAFANGVLKIPFLVCLRFLPPLFTLLAIIPAYLLGKYFFSKSIAFVSVLLSFLFPSTFFYYIGAGGIVRALALGLCLIALWLAFRGFSQRNKLDLVLSSLFFGATILTHLSYVVFFILSLGLFLLIWERKVSSFLLGGAIVAGGLLVSAPWWISVIGKYGPLIFASVFNSHQNGDILNRFRNPMDVYWLGRTMYLGFNGMVFVGLLSLLGVTKLLLRKNFFVPVWFLAVLCLTSESDRYIPFLAGMISGYFLWSLIEDLARLKAFQRIPRFSAVVIILLVCVNSIHPIFIVLQQKPGISAAITRLAAWFQNHTSPDSDFMVLSNNENMTEWFPYYLQRPLTYEYWGAEWLGTYPRQEALWQGVMECSTNRSVRCAEEIFQAQPRMPNYLIISVAATGHSVEDQLSANAAWNLEYKDADFSVWKSYPARSLSTPEQPGN